MTRHRDQATLYAGRDELTNITVLSDSMSRSGAKETTLDDTKLFAERRGLARQTSTSRATPIAREEQDRSLQRQHAVDAPSGVTRASNPVDPALHIEPAKVFTQAYDVGPHQSREYHTPAPLIPAITHYDRTVEDIAREKAWPHLERDLETLRSVAQNVYRDPSPSRHR